MCVFSFLYFTNKIFIYTNTVFYLSLANILQKFYVKMEHSQENNDQNVESQNSCERTEVI